MTVQPDQIKMAQNHGLINVEHLAAACDEHDLRFYLGCTILQKETGGKNIYGHDAGGTFTVSGNKEVTEENFREFWSLVAPPPEGQGRRSNGVGPMQITYKPFLADMLAKGLKPWEPADNIDYGIGLIAKTYRAQRNRGRSVLDSFRTAANVYNLGHDSTTWHYGIDAVRKAETWKARVGTADLGTTPLPPKPTGDPVTDFIASLPVSHSGSLGADYVTVKGASDTDEHFLPLDLEIVLRCAAAVGWGPVVFIKGGLEPGGASALTHSWLGAGDLRTRDHTTAEVWEFAAALIRSGIVAFPRGYGQDSFDKHIHFASREAGDRAHESTRRQIAEFLDGGDGLVGSRDYHGPSVRLGTWGQSPVNPVNITPDTGTYVVTTDGANLLGRDVDRKIIARAPSGSTIVAAKRVKRFDRDNIVTADETYYAADYLRPVEVG